MPTPDWDERFRRWLKLTAEMHENAHFTANESIAWALLRKPLNACTIALVSTAGVHLKSQPAHDVLNPHGDPSFREIPGDTQASDLAVDHTHYDTTDANADPNCVFPIDRLRELAADGTIAGVSNVNVGFMGTSPRLREVYEETAPAIADRVERSKADAIVLTAG